MSTKLVYTKAIKDGRLKTTEMEVGTSFTGTVKSFEEGKYGKIAVIAIAGRDIRVSPSGNLKQDINKGKINEGTSLTVTRIDDVTSSKGFTVTQYEIEVNASTPAVTQTQAPTTQQKLQAIRNGNN